MVTPRIGEGPRRRPSGEERRLNDLDLSEANVVDGLCRIHLRRAVETRIIAPIAEEDVSVEQPQSRVDARLFESSGQSDRGVETGTDTPVEDLGGRPDLLPVEPPARGRRGISNVASSHALVDRPHDRIHTLARPLLISVERWAARRLLKSVGRLDEQRCDRWRIRLNECRQKFDSELQRVCSPLIPGEHGDRTLVARDGHARGVAQRHADRTWHRVLDREHARRVEGQINSAQHGRCATVEVSQHDLRVPQRTERTDRVDLDGRSPQLRASVIDRHLRDDRDSAQRLGVAQVGQRMYMYASLAFKLRCRSRHLWKQTHRRVALVGGRRCRGRLRTTVDRGDCDGFCRRG